MRKRRNAPATGVPVAQQAAEDSAEAVFTITELAARWRCSRHTVVAAMKDGRLQGFKVGERTYRVRGEEVLRYEQTHMMKAAS